MIDGGIKKQSKYQYLAMKICVNASYCSSLQINGYQKWQNYKNYKSIQIITLYIHKDIAFIIFDYLFNTKHSQIDYFYIN